METCIRVRVGVVRELVVWMAGLGGARVTRLGVRVGRVWWHRGNRPIKGSEGCGVWHFGWRVAHCRVGLALLCGMT